jgi:hypothetical protein
VTTGIAIAVFMVAYLLIATEKVPKTAAALCGAGRVHGLGVADRTPQHIEQRADSPDRGPRDRYSISAGGSRRSQVGGYPASVPD